MDHKTRELPALYWWILVGLALVNYVYEPWNSMDLSIFATVTMLGAVFWWLGVMGQGDILALVASAAIAPGIAIDYMAWSVMALAGLVPAVLILLVRQKKAVGVGMIAEMRSMVPMMPFLCIGFMVAPLMLGVLTL
jgi:hypothetical protein